MSKKKQFGYDPLSQTAPSTVQIVDSTIYGESLDIDLPKIDKRTALPISIFEISADLAQPRRALPTPIRRSWGGDAMAVPTLLSTWHQFVEHELGRPINIHDHLHQIGDGDEDSDSTSSIVKKFINLLKLASSIRIDGLTNPITLISTSTKNYRIETGERRWLAYHLLNMYSDDGDQWTKIPAIVVDGTRSVWRQAIENNQREDLNAIEFARQIALLLMDIYKSRGSEFLLFDEFNHERDFYAQVADGVTWRVPRGMGEQILVAMGLSNKVQLSRYRDILDLPADLWELADEKNLPEFRIRDLLAKHKLSAGNLSSPTPPMKEPPIERFWRDFEGFSKKHTQIAGRVGEAERRQMADALRKLADDLERTKK